MKMTIKLSCYPKLIVRGYFFCLDKKCDVSIKTKYRILANLAVFLLVFRRAGSIQDGAPPQSMLKYFKNCWIEHSEILCGFSWSPDDESLTDFGDLMFFSSSTMRLTSV